MNKYHNKKTTVGDITFDSRAEAARYAELKLLERAGAISGLRLQVSFELVPKQSGERSVVYKADFVYTERGRTVVEDVKGMRTRDYIIKRKLLKWRYPDVDFREVKKGR